MSFQVCTSERMEWEAGYPGRGSTEERWREGGGTSREAPLSREYSRCAKSRAGGRGPEIVSPNLAL